MAHGFVKINNPIDNTVFCQTYCVKDIGTEIRSLTGKRYKNLSNISKRFEAAKNMLPLLMALFCVVGWGASYAVTRSAVDQIPPLTLAGLRFYISAALLWFPIRKIKVRLDGSDCLPVFNLTMTGITLYFAFENIGLKLTTASHGSLIIATIPLGTELVWAWRRRCWPKLNVWLGTVTALSGVALLVGFSTGEASVTGDILMFGAVACWIVYTFQVGRISRRYPPLLITYWMMLIGAITLTPGALIELWLFPWPRPTRLAWAQVLFLSIICSVLGYDLWNRAVPSLGPTAINTLLYLIPLIGVISGILFLNEPVTPTIFFGGGLIFLGVIWVKHK